MRTEKIVYFIQDSAVFVLTFEEGIKLKERWDNVYPKRNNTLMKRTIITIEEEAQ